MPSSPDISPHWDTVWRTVAGDLNQDPLAAKFLTEDRIRAKALLALYNSGIHVGQRAEIDYVATSHSASSTERMDLVLDPLQSATAIAFKYVREPSRTQSQLPEQLSSVLADTYRLSLFANNPAQTAQRIQVLVAGHRFLNYMKRITSHLKITQYEGNEHTPASLHLTARTASRLPAVITQKLPPGYQTQDVIITRTTELSLASKGLTMAVYDVGNQSTMLS